MMTETTGKTSGAVVTVACKLPAGLTVRDGDKTVKLNGSNDEGSIAGFGITQGVDADWFDKWTKGDGKDLAAVKSGAIFANTAAKANDQAKERRKLVAGFEPLDPAAPMDGVAPTRKPGD